MICDEETGFKEFVKKTNEECCFYNLFFILQQILSMLEVEVKK